MPNSYDVIVIGAGPAGISAALTARNRGKSVAVIGNPPETANLYKAEKINNYPGISGSGAEILAVMQKQLTEAGAVLVSGRALTVMPMGKSIGVAVGNDFTTSKAVILATGISRRPLCEGETEFLGRGVSYCTTCDGMLYRGKNVAVIGGNEEEIEFLRSIGCTVEVFSEKGKFEIRGGMKADTLIANGKEYKTDCIFILTDKVTSTSLVPGLETENGAIVTDRRMSTSIPGIFACGDCTGAPYQLAIAAGEGNMAALSAVDYISKL